MSVLNRLHNTQFICFGFGYVRKKTSVKTYCVMYRLFTECSLSSAPFKCCSASFSNSVNGRFNVLWRSDRNTCLTFQPCTMFKPMNQIPFQQFSSLTSPSTRFTTEQFHQSTSLLSVNHKSILRCLTVRHKSKGGKSKKVEIDSDEVGDFTFRSTSL